MKKWMMTIAMLTAPVLVLAEDPKPPAKPGTTEKALGKTGKVIDKAADKTVEGTKDAAEATGHGAKKVGAATVRGVKKAAHATETGARKATAATGEGMVKAGETMKKADPKKDKESETVKK